MLFGAKSKLKPSSYFRKCPQYFSTVYCCLLCRYRTVQKLRREDFSGTWRAWTGITNHSSLHCLVRWQRRGRIFCRHPANLNCECILWLATFARFNWSTYVPYEDSEQHVLKPIYGRGEISVRRMHLFNRVGFLRQDDETNTFSLRQILLNALSLSILGYPGGSICDTRAYNLISRVSGIEPVSSYKLTSTKFK